MDGWEKLSKGQVIVLPVRLRALMQAAGMKTHDLSQATGIDRQTCNYIMTGRIVVREHEAHKIATALPFDVKAEDLFEV